MSTGAPPVDEGLAERLGSTRAVAYGGIVLGLLAVWIALPPWTVTAGAAPVALAIAGAAAGIWAITRGEQRLGWWAVAAAVAGVAMGLWAQGRDEATLEAVISTGLFAATLRYATPLTFAALGGIFSERSGVINIGLEGMMIAGAFFAIWGAAETGSWVGGLVLAMAAGGTLALVHGVFSIHLQANQIVSGTAINLFALGLSGYLFRELYGDQGTPTDLSRIPQVSVPGLRDLPFLGDVIGDMNLMTWLMLALIVVTWFVIFRTPFGLRMRAVGEHPRAADTVGISVYGVRYVAVVLSGMLAALGGAYLSLAFVGSFTENMTAGRGFIALAAVIFGRWRPGGAFAACLLFGGASALAQRLQAEADISANLLQTLPYVLTLVALVGLVGRSRPPAAVGRPYAK